MYVFILIAAVYRNKKIEMHQVVVDAILRHHAYSGQWWMLNGLDCTYFSEDLGSKENRCAVRRLVDLYVRCAHEKKQDDLSDLWQAEQMNTLACLVDSFEIADEKTIEELKKRLDEAIASRNASVSNAEDTVPLGSYWIEVTAEQQLAVKLDEITEYATKRCGRTGCVWKFWCSKARKEVIEVNEARARSRVETFIDDYKRVASVEEENKLIYAMLFSDKRVGFGKGSSDTKSVFWKYAELLRPYRKEELGPFRADTRKWTSPM